MTKRFIAAAIAAIAVMSSLTAQTIDDTKILVFRKSGVTNVFHSNTLKGIELSHFDADSVEHAEIVSQAFRRTDGTSMLIPIADIDSVAFGARDIITPKPGVRRLTQEEAEVITKFDGTHLYYKDATPASLMVRAGETVYYDASTDAMPYGLCATVKAVDKKDGATVADIDYRDPADVFDRYFLSSEEGMAKVFAKPSYKDDNSYKSRHFEYELPRTDNDRISVGGEISLDITPNFTDGVVDLRNHYYHGIIRMDISPTVLIQLLAKNSIDISCISEPMPWTFRTHFMMGMVTLEFGIGAFFDFNAEAGIDYEYKRNYSVAIEWTRSNDTNIFSAPEFVEHTDGDSQAKMDMHLSGELFFGPLLDVSVGVLFNAVGAGALVKVGPNMEAELSAGILSHLGETWDWESYKKSKIDVKARGKIETYWFNREHLLLFGEKQRHKLPLTFDKKIGGFTINLFPWFNSRSTVGRERHVAVRGTDRAKAIDVASYTETPVATPLPMGFEIADAETDTTIARWWGDGDDAPVIEAGSSEAQAFDTEFVLRDELKDVDPDKVVLRPVFRYSDKVIKAAPVAPLSGMALSPIIFHGAHHGRYIVTGQPFVHQSEIDTTVYIQGNIVPVPEIDNKFGGKRTATVVEFREDEDPDKPGTVRDNLIYGSWRGRVDGKDVTFVFNSDRTGSYCGIPFTYRLNSPRTGGVSIVMENGSTMTFYVNSIDATTIEMTIEHTRQKVTLTKN